MTDRTSAPAQGTPTWADLTTSDPEGARAFYGDLFGWGYADGLPGREAHATAELAGRPVAGIGAHREEEEGSPAAWTTHLAVDDLDRALGVVEALGGRVFSGPTRLGKAARVATVSDPSGAVFGLWEPGSHHGSAAVDEPGATTYAEVWTDDATSTTEFYTTLLGLPSDVEQVGTMSVVAAGGTDAFGIWAAGAAVGVEGAGPHWVVYFAVADVDATAARAVELGGRVHAAPDDSPAGRWALLADPAGARFGVTVIDAADTAG